MMRTLAVLTAAATLSGCVVGPNYTRPNLDPEAAFRAPLALSQAASVADLEWFAVFNDPQLVELVRVALANNLDLQQALARIEVAQAGLRIARGAFWPDIRGQVRSTPAASEDSNDTTFIGGLATSWEFDIFGKLRRSNEAARADLLATEDGTRAVMAALVCGVAATWYSLRELDEEVRIIERTIESQEASLALVRSLMGGGVASEVEELQASAQLASTRARLPRAQQQVASAEHGLSVLLGQAPQAIAQRRRFGEGTDIAATALSVGLPTDLLERRPDIRQAENALHAATARVGVAIANRFPIPTIGLSGLVGRFGGGIDDLFDADDSIRLNAWGPTLDLQILDFGRAKGGVEAAEARTRQALVAYRATVLAALREVADSLYAYEASGRIIEQTEIYARAAESTLRLQRLRFQAGVVDYLSVLDAERQLLTAEISLAQSRLARTVSFIDIYRSMGGGWSDDELQRMTN